jgi:hypothetical protein
MVISINVIKPLEKIVFDVSYKIRLADLESADTFYIEDEEENLIVEFFRYETDHSIWGMCSVSHNYPQLHKEDILALCIAEVVHYVVLERQLCDPT